MCDIIDFKLKVKHNLTFLTKYPLAYNSVWAGETNLLILINTVLRNLSLLLCL